ncbi:alpha/beta hydrolase [Burkholderia pseudomallei]|uniref:alpha/beta hydrolase n=1 Tax=Burkholderia pseudomallei TaxID=28450 RepID=UPI0008FF1E5C|nr:alpha/beta hydrolase [Burkholderia pseudomallei]APD36814.1 alpha/beta hydrolase [Burkholderia pseudomallei]ARK39691.1 alpha/beta hydrolase [Burkholderia pseudomallei]ARL58910.1 alpha/beta hydrolase [Burkholderia pseudomallei]ARL65326.1 alpha/beta hydrolase [Burkholderia pseudomallei]
MNQKFSGDVGQVAGRDVKSSSAQASVNLHFHSGESKPVVTKYISDKQRNVIARKAFEIQDRTGTDKLMVYRRLMTVFDFERMEEMPRNVYGRAIKYLDSWMRNGALGQAPAAPVQQEVKAPTPEPQSVIPSESQDERPAPQVVATPAVEPEPAPALRRGRKSPWAAVSIAVTATMAVAAALYVVAYRPDAPVQTQAAGTSLHCEYAGNRYSLGSVVMQAGVRRQCATAGDDAAWQKADTVGR